MKKLIKSLDELWQEIEEIALHEPIVRSALFIQNQENLTREHTAIGLVLALNYALKATRESYLTYIQKSAVQRLDETL